MGNQMTTHVTPGQRRQAKLYAETKAAVEAVASPGLRALRRVVQLEGEMEQLKSQLEARLTRLERPFWKGDTK
jgi:hypothetical protein